VARHISISFSQRNQLFTSASKSSVFALDIFHSLFGFGRIGDVGDVDPWADPPVSLWDLLFLVPAPVFMLLDGEDFILQVHGVFTRIRSEASLVASSSDARGSATTAQQQGSDGWNGLDLFQQLRMWGMENPKGFSLYL
jgi:hypothetical protein